MDIVIRCLVAVTVTALAVALLDLSGSAAFVVGLLIGLATWAV